MSWRYWWHRISCKQAWLYEREDIGWTEDRVPYWLAKAMASNYDYTTGRIKYAPPPARRRILELFE